MTALRQEAINIIKDIPENHIKQVVIFLQSLTKPAASEELSKKKEAFLRLEKFRKEEAPIYFSDDFDVEKEIKEALEEKYGRVD